MLFNSTLSKEKSSGYNKKLFSVNLAGIYLVVAERKNLENVRWVS